MKHRLLVGLSVLAVLGIATTAPTAPRRKAINFIAAKNGLFGSGTGPTRTLGIKNGGVTTTHVMDGTLTEADFAPGTLGTDGPGPGGTRSELVRVGAPAVGGGTFVGGASVLAVNRASQVLFKAEIDTDGNTATDEEGLYLASPTGTVRLLKTGDVVNGMTVAGISGSQTHRNILTDTGKAFLRLDVASYIPNNTREMTALVGFSNNQFFTIIGAGSQTQNGLLLSGANDLALLSPNRLVFKSTLFAATGGTTELGESVQVYEGQ